MRRVFRQHAARVTRFHRLPCLATCLQFFRGNSQGDFPLLRVNRDGVAILHERERPAGVSFRRDVPDHEAVAAAGKPSVGDERHVLAESLAHDGRRGRKHLAHPRPAARPFVADDDDVALHNRAVEDRGHRGFLGIVNARASGEFQTFLAGNFSDCAFGSEVAVPTWFNLGKTFQIKFVESTRGIILRELGGSINLNRDSFPRINHFAAHALEGRGVARDDALAA